MIFLINISLHSFLFAHMLVLIVIQLTHGLFLFLTWCCSSCLLRSSAYWQKDTNLKSNVLWLSFWFFFSGVVHDCHDKLSINRIYNIAVECIFHPSKRFCWPKCQVNCCMKTSVCKRLVVLLYQVMTTMYVSIIIYLSQRKYIHRR